MQLQLARRTVHVATVIVTLTGTGLLTYLLSTIPVSYYVIGSGPISPNPNGAAIALPSALVGILIGILLTVCVFALAAIFKSVANSKSRALPL